MKTVFCFKSQLLGVACLLMPMGSLPALAAPFTAEEVHGPINEVNPAVDTMDAAGIVALFERACIATDGQNESAIDWALSNAFEPIDEPRVSAGTLLNGEAGTVLAAPKTQGHVMLAVGSNQCAVWAENTSGPPLRAAFLSKVKTFGAKGNQIKPVFDRNVQRAGAWRNQSKWRFQSTGSTKRWDLNTVTTLVESPGTQVLRLSVLPGNLESKYAPDGVPKE
jgi:hypothetical protein